MLVSLAIILTFALLKDSLVFAGLVEVQSKLYTIAFLATLNARQHWRVRNKNVVHEIISMEMSPRMPAGQDPASPLPQIEILTTISKVTDNMLCRDHTAKAPMSERSADLIKTQTLL